MNRNSSPPDDSWESDAVWKLLDQAPSRGASARFVENTVRAAKLAPVMEPWWKRVLSPAPLVGFAGVTAAVAFAFVSLIQPAGPSSHPMAVLDSPQAVAIQDIAETETLIAAVDLLDDFSDHELVSLIGF
jgi:hypothetical protein